jgi:hypothetical protein
MSDIRSSKNWAFETRQLHIGQEHADPVTDARAVPIYASTSFVFHNSQHAADRFGLRDAGNIYGRLTNPTNDIFEQRIASLEGGSAALAVASGAAAISYTFQALARSGEHIVASKTIYGGTYNLLAHTLPLTSGITTTFVDPEVEGSFEAAITEKTKAVFVETLGNPNSNLVDIEALADVAHRHVGVTFLPLPQKRGVLVDDIVRRSLYSFSERLRYRLVTEFGYRRGIRRRLCQRYSDVRGKHGSRCERPRFVKERRFPSAASVEVFDKILDVLRSVSAEFSSDHILYGRGEFVAAFDYAVQFGEFLERRGESRVPCDFVYLLIDDR